MNRSTDRILATHTGRLFMPDAGNVGMGLVPTPPDRVRDEVTTLVGKQIEIGMDAISNGEPACIGPGMLFTVVDGVEVVDADLPDADSTARLKSFSFAAKDWLGYPDFYCAMYGLSDTTRRTRPRTVISGPLKLSSLDLYEKDISLFKDVLTAQAPETEAFYCVTAPGWIEQFVWNEYYQSDEDLLGALAEVVAPIYRMVTDNGLILQIDDPAIPKASREVRRPEMSDAEYERFVMVRVEALNAALAGIPEEMVRFHCCWGSEPGLHVDQTPLRQFAKMMLRVNAQAYSIESAKSPHRLEWMVWRDDLSWPEDKIIIPGVVDHTTNVVEPPELIADSLVRFADLCGRENVIAGTDCGMRGHADANWAKYENIVRGAELASSQLW